MHTAAGPRATTKPKVMAGAALALALTTYGIVAKRRASAQGAAQPSSPAAPGAIPKQDWRNLSRRVARGFAQKQLTFVAAGAAFYAFLAIPATLAVFTSLALLLFEPDAVQRALRPAAHLVPPYVMQLLSAPHSHQVLGIGLIVSLAFEMGSVLSGGSCMLNALRLVYGERSKRSFFNRQMTVLVLAAITVPFVLLSLALMLVLPAAIDLVPISSFAKTSISVIRWPILAALFMSVLVAVYRYAPHRTEQRWHWTSWGVVIAVMLWIAGSAVFTLYVTQFAPRDPTYGALGSIMGLLAWLDFTALTVLLGAQIDAEMESER